MEEEQEDGAPFPVRRSMQAKLEAELQPVELVIEDQSDQHAGHSGTKGLRSGETHFAVRVVSDAFDGLNAVKRQRMVYALLADELAGGVHALSLVTKTPAEASA